MDIVMLLTSSGAWFREYKRQSLYVYPLKIVEELSKASANMIHRWRPPIRILHTAKKDQI